MQLQALAVLVVLYVQVDDRPPPSSEEIAAAAQQLGSDNFAQREEATRLLWGAWPASQKVLELATKATDREVAARAKAVIDNVRLGVFPDTPSAAVQLIAQYRAADDNERPKILQQIHDM